jgi:NAD(P)-dependent dehydrogenase (short-subunit alcohol dehydrogenase family)
MTQERLDPQNPYSLEGKRVLVTGAGTGIGQGIALAAAHAGADVALHYASSAAGAMEAVSQISALGGRSIAIQGNLTSVAECRRVVDEAAAFLGGLDGIVSNAGVTLTSDFLGVSEEQFDRIYGLNIRGQFFCAQQAVRHMIQRGEELRNAAEKIWAGGSVVNISSVHGLVGCPGHSVYAGTKGAINAFSRELAVELLPAHIRVNVIAPGTIEVPSYWKVQPDYTREFGNFMVPWGRVGLPADVAHLAVYLLSDASEFMTGQVLYLDGGLTAKMALPYQPPAGER